ncbi:MAG: NAD(P)H-quinone oxidoreductase [Calditrichaeota bacterium]|nr:MAG: NAD(P)H-quinone oxidoreductase [Calditrichota bacterium]
MKAILVRKPGGPEELYLGEFPTPEPKSDELLVRVKATALNRADIMQREGKYPPPEGASPILGLEMAGVVEKVGADCTGWHWGDRVCGLLPGGGYAEYAVIPARMAIPIPDNLTFEEAAAIPEAFLTAYQALHWVGKLQAGETVLIHAGASGVGTAAIQLAREAGATVIVTSSSARKLDFCLHLGAKVGINYSDGEFAAGVLEATEKQGVNLLLDCIGAPIWEQNLRCLALDGRMVILAVMGGRKIPHFDLAPILLRRLQIMGTTLRNRSQAYKIELTREFVKHILPLIEEGRVKPIIDSVFPWEQVQEAHRRMEQKLNVGKIVLKVGE